MSCITSLVGGVYFARWEGPVPGDLTRIAREIAVAARWTRQRLVYVSIVPDEGGLLDTTMRAKASAHLTEVGEACESVHFVIEGQGFRSSAQRSMVTGILVSAGRQAVNIHTSLRAALEAAEHQTGRKLRNLGPLAQEKGVASVPPPSSRAGARAQEKGVASVPPPSSRAGAEQRR